MKRSFYGLFVFLLIILPSAELFAQQNVSAPQKFALVIGNAKYVEGAPLRNAENDANDITTALQGLGFTVDKLLNASLDQMEDAAIRLKNRLSVSTDSYGFFFYAGHGVQADGVNYLLPVDARIPEKSFLKTKAFAMQPVLDMLNDAGNALNVIVLDACRDLPMAWSRSADRGLSVVNRQPAKSIIMYATAAGKTASDGTGRNGLFTQHLLTNLKTPGLDVKEVFNRTGEAVANESNYSQLPATYSSFYGTAYLGSRPTPNAPVQPSPAPAVQPAGQTDSVLKNRRYTATIQQVFNFIQRNYVEEVDSKAIFEGAMTGIFNALGDSNSVFLLKKELNNTTQGSIGEAATQVFNFIQRNYVAEVDSKVIFEGAMTGMFNALGDSNSVFLPESEMKDLNDTTQRSFGGVGLYITKHVGNNYVEVASPIEDTPSWRAGINPGDLIISINGELTDKLTTDEFLGRLRGTPGTVVNLVIRRGDKLKFSVSLTRTIIEVPTAKYAMIGDIGYLKLLTFTTMTVERAANAINDFKAKNFKGVILDLRNNYGGLFNSAIGVSSLFLEGGVVVSTKSRIETENRVFNTSRPILVPSNIPVIVLINKGSAGASEIVAGALKDRGRAFLVGEKSYGRGSIQQVYPLDTAGFKITTARYYTPRDVNIDIIGIPPDRLVKFPDFTDEDAEKLNTMINDNKIPSFVKDNPRASPAQIETFARTLERDYKLDFSLLKRLIRNEQNRTTIAPVYDLEYDVQLQEAVNILRSGEYRTLMQSAKTLRALQEEASKDG